MAKPLKTDQLRKNLLADISSAEALVTKVRSLANIHPGGDPRSLHIKYVYRVVELAFMGVVAEWEDFIEQTFIRYLSTGVSGSGYSPPHKIGKSKDMQHSYAMLSHDTNYDPAKHYLRFSDPAWTVSQAEFFFDGGAPYGTIRTNMARLKDANKIRNRVAHGSKKCKADFKAVALAYTNPAGNTLSSGYRVGNLLSSSADRHFGAAARNGDYLQAFFNMFKTMAGDICPT